MQPRPKPTEIYSITGIMTEGDDEVNAFGGFFKPEPTLPGNHIVGLLNDKYGPSMISGEFENKERLHFGKIYPGRKPITYDFSFDEARRIWVGNYAFSKGKGEAVCKVVRAFKQPEITAAVKIFQCLTQEARARGHDSLAEALIGAEYFPQD